MSQYIQWLADSRSGIMTYYFSFLKLSHYLHAEQEIEVRIDRQIDYSNANFVQFNYKGDGYAGVGYESSTQMCVDFSLIQLLLSKTKRNVFRNWHQAHGIKMDFILKYVSGVLSVALYDVM